VAGRVIRFQRLAEIVGALCKSDKRRFGLNHRLSVNFAKSLPPLGSNLAKFALGPRITRNRRGDSHRTGDPSGNWPFAHQFLITY
jgi:hypothetical protein